MGGENNCLVFVGVVVGLFGCCCFSVIVVCLGGFCSLDLCFSTIPTKREELNFKLVLVNRGLNKLPIYIMFMSQVK